MRQVEFSTLYGQSYRFTYEGDVLVELASGFAILSGESNGLPFPVPLREFTPLSPETGLPVAPEAIWGFDLDGLVVDRVDGTGGYDWVETWRDDGGEVVLENAVDLDGISAQTVNIFGGEIVITADVGDTAGWAMRWTSTYSPDGPSHVFEVQDDGDIVESSFAADGMLEDQTFHDVSDQRNWLTRTRHYDEDGNLAIQSFDMDDGRYTFRTWTDGVLTEARSIDRADAFSWNVITSLYDDAGQIEDRFVFRDNGIEVHTAYEEGVRAQKTLTDHDDARAWDTIEIFYDATGQEVDRIVTLDPADDMLF